jgi:hypothetical protein
VVALGGGGLVGGLLMTWRLRRGVGDGEVGRGVDSAAEDTIRL